MAKNRRQRNRSGRQTMNSLPRPGRMPIGRRGQNVVVARDRIASQGTVILEKDQSNRALTFPIAPYFTGFSWDKTYKYLRIVSVEIALFSLRPATEGVRLFAWMSDPSIKDTKKTSDLNDVVNAWSTAVRKSQCVEGCLRTTFRPPTSVWLPNNPAAPGTNVPVTNVVSACDVGFGVTGTTVGPTPPAAAINIASYHVYVVVEYKDPVNFGDAAYRRALPLDAIRRDERSNDDLADTDLNHPQFLGESSLIQLLPAGGRVADLSVRSNMSGAITTSWKNDGGWEYESSKTRTLEITGYTQSVKIEVKVEDGQLYAPAWNYLYPNRTCESCHAVRVTKQLQIKVVALDNANYYYYPSSIADKAYDDKACVSYTPTLNIVWYRVRGGHSKKLLDVDFKFTSPAVAYDILDGFLLEDDLLIQHVRYHKEYKNGHQEGLADYWYSCITYNMVWASLIMVATYEPF